jgi:hypothetical protein
MVRGSVCAPDHGESDTAECVDWRCSCSSIEPALASASVGTARGGPAGCGAT